MELQQGATWKQQRLKLVVVVHLDKDILHIPQNLCVVVGLVQNQGHVEIWVIVGADRAQSGPVDN